MKKPSTGWERDKLYFELVKLQNTGLKHAQSLGSFNIVATCDTAGAAWMAAL